MSKKYFKILPFSPDWTYEMKYGAYSPRFQKNSGQEKQNMHVHVQTAVYRACKYL